MSWTRTRRSRQHLSIFIAEIGHTLRRELVRKRVSVPDMERIWRDLSSLPIAFHGLPELAEQAWQLALTHIGRFYDALYIALAIREDTKVITADQKMVNAFADLDRAIFLPEFVPR